MRAAIYARYSSERQNERSIDDQVAVLTDLAGRRGWTVVGAFTDAAISGAAMANRPGLVAALAAGEAGAFDVLLVEDEDRIARNLEHQAHVFNRLKRVGVAIATLGSERIGILEVGLKGMMAELYLTNLSDKTRRGMRSNAEKGLATGSRLYGYRTAPGGDMRIVPEEAAVIRRICALYADDGLSGREIADRLNRDHVPGPRGGTWNGSTINGSRQRGNGVLNTDLYAGEKVWNRMDVVKDPVTGRRRPMMKPPADWRRTPVPHLRIVDQALWERVRARKGAEAEHAPRELANRRKPGIFSGLLRCGVCGASYTSYSKRTLVCAAHREKGDSICANARRVSREAVETRVLAGLQTRLLTPEATAAYVRAYHAAWEAEARADRDRRAPLMRRLGELERSIERLVDAICDGSASPAMRQRLAAQEAEKAEVAAKLDSLAGEAPPPVTLHPRAAEAYAAQVTALRALLSAISADPDLAAANRNLIDAVRGLVDRIEIHPRGASKRGEADFDLTLHGNLAVLLEPVPDQPNTLRGGLVVAGGGIEPPTCGL